VVKEVTKHTSYQVPTPTCVSTKVPSSRNLSKTKFCRYKKYFGYYSPSLPS